MTKPVSESKSTRNLFIAGTLMLLVPLAIIVGIGFSCTSTSCVSSSENRIINGFFPFPMIAGGLMLAYGMKRVADAKVETEEEADGSSEPE